MAQIDMLCPFTEKLCDECPLYRGRHYYLGSCKNYRGYLGKAKGAPKSGTDHQSVDFQALRKLMEPWAGHRVKADPKLRLKVIDMETGKARVCPLEEAKTWDWDNPKMMRMISGFHITSWERLTELASFKAKKGYREVEVYEGPRFMLLGGG